MGHRANLVLVENKESKIYYTHSRAQEMPNILAQGLDFCEKYFKGFDEDGWLMDNAFAEGGILIDKDSQKILIFGGADMSSTPALQRLFCKYIAKIWEGWEIEWCSKGIVDFAEYLGVMEDRILADGCEPVFCENGEWSCTMKTDRTQDEIITIINNGVICDYKQDWGLYGINICIAKGEILKDVIPHELKIDRWHNEIETTNCLLVDYDTKRIFVCWGADTDGRHDDEVRNIWRGWDVQRQTDGLIFHFDYTNRDKSVVELTDEQFEEYCLKNKLFEFGA